MSSGGGGAPQRNLYQETAGELQAKLDLMPQIYAAESAWGPQYTLNDLQTLQTLMMGTEGGTTTTPYSTRAQQAGYYDAEGNLVSTDRYQYWTAPSRGTGGGGIGNIFGIGGTPRSGAETAKGSWNIPEGLKWISKGGSINTTRTTTTPASPGLLTMMEQWSPRLAAIDAANATAQREADINDVATLGAKSREAMDAADPETAKLIAMMTGQATDELALGSQLTPEQQRQITNTTTARAGANGWGYNPGDLTRTAMATTDYAQSLEDRRREYAGGITALRSGYYGDAFNRVLGRPVSNPASGAYSQGMSAINSAAPRLFGSTVNANDVYSSNQNAAASNAATAANNQSALVGAGITGAVSIGAALI